MKTRDRVISIVMVGGIIAVIWWGGSALRHVVGGGEGDAGDAGDGAVSESGSPQASASAAPSATSSAPVAIVDAAVAPSISGACRTMNAQSKKKLDDAKAARACTPTFDESSLACKTSSNGATWGLRVDDVIDLGSGSAGECATGWLVRLVHLDVNGAETAVVPGLAKTKLAHTYDVDAITRLSDVAFFDWDGDGEDEVFVRGARPGEERSVVWTFKNNAIAPYAPAAPFKIASVRDVDGDGRPDAIVELFGTGIDAPPTTHEFIAHSLADGTFTLHDATAVAWAEKQCPSDPKLDVSTKSPSDFDASVADALVCELLWGADPKKLEGAVAAACKSAPCPTWAVSMMHAKPGLSLR
jgi:hypothetical protein